MVRIQLDMHLIVGFCNYTYSAQIELGEYDDSRDQDCNANDASDCAPPVQRVGIESITAHPQYGSYLRDDIALVRLDRDVVLDGEFK